MKATELLYQVNELGILLWVETTAEAEDKLKFALLQPLADKTFWFDQIKLQKTELIRLLKAAGVHSDQLQLPLIYPAETQPFMLSYAQKRLWFLQQFAPDSAAYNVPLILQLQKDHPEAARQALVALLQRHQVLRTLLVRQGAEPVGLLQEASALDFSLQQLDPAASLHFELKQQLSRPFVLDQQLPLRACYFRQSGKEAVLLICLHHIAVDGWSLPQLLHEFEQYFLHFSEGQPIRLAEQKLQYQDFACYQHLVLHKKLESQWQYWQQQLLDLQPLELPLDRARPAQFDATGSTEQLTTGPELAEALQQLARRSGCSFYALTLSAYFVLLHHYCQQQDLLIGTATANRHYPGCNDIIGFFVNSLPIRCQLDGSMRLTDLLALVQQQLIAAQQHQDMPFDLLVEKLQLPRDPSCHPLFQVFFALQQSDQGSHQAFELLTPDGLYQVAKYDLSLFVTQGKTGLTLELNYATALFDPHSIRQMLAHYHQLLQQFVAHPEQPLQQLTLLSDAERRHLILELNDTACVLPPVNSVLELFRQQALYRPQQRALSFNGEQLSYHQLDQRSTELAQLLVPALTNSDLRLVALLMQRSLELIVAIVAIHKAGAAYVPIAPEFPLARQNFILQDTAAVALISHQPLQQQVAALSKAPAVLWADQMAWHQDTHITDSSLPQLPEQIQGDQLAYIIYTSGTTGNPKGVMLEHRHLLNRIDWMQRTYPLDDRDIVLQKTPYIFDVSVWELVWATAYGAQILLAKPEGHKDPDYLYQLMTEQQVTVVHFVPTMFQAFLDDLKRRDRTLPASLRYIFCSGEALSGATVQQFFHLNSGGSVQLHNLYGPTETAIDSSYYHCQTAERTVPIGKPVQNTQLYILDQHQQLVAKGVTGELYIAGHGVARGYLNLPELTAERFLPNPFYDPIANPTAGTRMYKTGDRVRMLNDGTIEYLGRNDFQLKLRGFRIEPAEIEAALCQLPCISQALVMVRQLAGQEVLLAYCQTDALPEPEQLRELLLQKLPDYMVPAQFIALSRFPVNANGKLDRKALPEPQLQSRPYRAAVTPQEQQLAALWQSVLQLDQVGMDDDFFRLGGNSILAISLSHAMAELLQKPYPVAQLFADKTISKALRHTTAQQPAVSAIPPHDPAKALLSFAQQRLWFLHQYDPGNSAYNIPMVLRLKPNTPLSAAVLEQSLALLLRRHQVLRCTISQQHEEALLQLHSAQSFALQRVQLKDEDYAHTFRECVNYVFDLQRDIPFKAWYFELPSGENKLLITIHHSAFDGWSHGIFMAELEQAIMHCCEGTALKWPELKLQYQDYASWQRQAFAAGQFVPQLQYWRQQLQHCSALQLPLDKARPPRVSYAGDNLIFRFSPELSIKLQQLAAQSGCSLYSLMLAGFAVLLHKYSQQQDIVLGTPFANRHHPQTEKLLGFFVNTLPLRLQIHKKQSWQHWLQHVSATVHEAQLNQDLPFEHLVDELKLPQDQSRHPLFQVLFSMDQFVEAAESAYLEAEDLGDNYQVAKYDLSLYIKQEQTQLSGALNFATTLFNRSSMQRLAERYLVLLQHIATAPDTEIRQLNWFSDTDQQELAVQPQRPATPYPAFAEVFYQQARQHATETALVWRSERWSYQQLDQDSNQLAHQLRQSGCGRGDSIAVLLPRGPELVLSILAILKAGAAYLPLSLDLPSSRIGFMLQDASCPLLLTDKTDLDYGVPLYNPMLRQYRTQPRTALPLYAAPDDLAYVIYTSGTTGQPKGVMVEQQSFTGFLLNFPLFVSEPWLHLLSLTSVTFDIFGLEYGLPLLRGGTLYLSDLQHIASDLQQHKQINLLQQTPSVLRSLLAMDLPDLSTLSCLVGGEALNAELLQQLQQRFARVVNVYGPTETVIWSTCHAYDKDGAAANPSCIGQALAYEQTYVLNDDQQLLPAGVVGELYIGGLGLARGYLNRAELTAERFIQHQATAQRLYKTGDLVKRTLDGQLEYKGRTDFQVKIRGHRIELADIEQSLLKHPQIKQCLVVAASTATDEAYLVAYYQAGQPLALSELQQSLATELPDYMCPEVFVHLEQFQLTANGKLDRASLPVVERRMQHDSNYLSAQSEEEKRVVAIWQQVLELDQIGLNDDFFRLGGNSIKALLLCHKMAKEADWTLSVAELFQYRSISQLLQHRTTATAKAGPVARPEQDSAVLSDSQNRLWFVYNLAPDSAAYHIPMLLQLKQYQPERLQQAFRRLLEHQHVLCSVIRQQDGKAWQYKVSADLFQLQQLSLPASELDSQLQECIQQPFALETELPIRATVLELDDGRCYLLILVHHIAFDGWSMDLLFEQLDQCYQQLPLTSLPYQYRDYARWQQQQPVAATLDPYWQQLKHWPPLDLRSCYPRPVHFDYRGADHMFSLSPALSAQVQQFARQQAVSVYQLLLSVWVLTLHKLTGQQQIVLGTPMANRQLAGTDNLIGFFVNTVVLHHQVDPNADFLSLLAQISQQSTLLQQQQQLPFESLLEQLATERDSSRHPLFQIMFSVQNFAEQSKTLDWLSPVPLPVAEHSAKYDLSLQLEIRDQQLSGVLNYASSLFSKERIASIQQGFVQLLQQVLQTPQAMNHSLSLLTAQQQAAMLALGDRQQQQSQPPYYRTLNQLFAVQVRQHPEQTALQLGQQRLSYAELDALSSQLAHQLLELTAEQQQLIVLCLPRSVWMIVAILAVLKTGSAWVPVEPSTPVQRLQHILTDSKAQLLLSLSGMAMPEAIQTQCTVLLLDQLDLSQKATTPPGLLLSPRDLAYVIYTSGTTGQPKGVLIEHQAVVNTIQNQQQQYQIGPDSVLYLGLSYAFDASVAVIMNALLSGATLLLSKEIDFDLPELCQVSHLIVSGAVLDLLQSDRLPALKYLIYGGATASPQALQRFRHLKLYAEYGVTEAAITSSLTLVNSSQSNSIGMPLANVSLYVLDEQLHAVPFGVTGELYIGGASVARGYLNQPELDRQSFIPSPFIQGDRLYKTGDLVRWHGYQPEEACLLFEGRKDKQLKLRGYRIELAEIEHQLLAEPAVQQVALKLHQLNGRDRLLAYLVTSEPEPELLVARLKTRLADFMQPDHWLTLPRLPLTSNGKLDEAALPLPAVQQDYLSPATETEQQLAGLWQQLLGEVKIGRNDDFFALGGDSILLMQLAALLKKSNWSCPVKTLMQHRSLQAMAAVLQRTEPQALVLAEQGQLSGSFALLPVQQWFFDLVHNGVIQQANYWNQSFLLKVQPLKLQQLEKAIAELVQHHDMLRCRFVHTDQGYQQCYQPDLARAPLKQLDRSQLTEQQLEQQLSQWQNQFDVMQGPLFQFGYISNYPDGSARVFFACHHLLIDAVSWRLLAEDLKTLYQQQALPEKTSSYRQWVAAQSAAAEHYPAHYWQSLLQSVASGKTDTKPEVTTSSQAQFELSPHLSDALLHQLPKASHVETQELFLSALALALKDVWGSEQQLIVLESHGRQSNDAGMQLNRTLGWFTSFYPLLLSASDDLHYCLGYNKDKVRRAADYAQSYIRSGCYLQHQQHSVSFNYLGQINAGRNADDWQIVAESSGANYPPEQKAIDAIQILAVYQEQRFRFSCSSLYAAELSNPLMACFEQRLLELIRFYQQHSAQAPLWLCDYPDFSPYQLYQPEQSHTVFVFPSGEADGPELYQPLLQQLPTSRVVLLNNFYRYLQQQHQEQAAACSFTDLARALLPVLHHLQPKGPWHFIGWSFGGVLALELCRLLEQQQQQPVSVQLIDSYFSLHKARLLSAELDQLLFAEQQQSINARHQPQQLVQTKVRLYKALRPSKRNISAQLRLLEQAYLQSSSNFIEDVAADFELIGVQTGHFDPLCDELVQALLQGFTC